MREELGEVAVIGEDQRALCIPVETADRMHRHAKFGDEIHHRARGMGIGARGDVAGRLVEEEVDAAVREGHRAPVYRDRLPLRVDLHPHLGDRLAVDGDVPGSDELLGLPSRSDAGGGENFVQPFFHSAPPQ